MNVSGVNSVNFTAKTDKGNDYKKTKAGKTTCGIIGASLIGINAYKMQKKGLFKKLTNHIDEQIKKNADINEYISKNPKANIEKFNKIFKKSIIGSFIATAAISFGLWVGIGAIIDGIVNHSRAKKADKAMAKV